MSQRRFAPGQTFLINGLELRVEQGKKSQRGTGELGHDLRLDWLTPRGWVAVPFAALGLLADFLYENEEHLFPADFGFQGGGKVLSYIRHSVKHGWTKAEAGLQAEKDAKRTLFDQGEES